MVRILLLLFVITSPAWAMEEYAVDEEHKVTVSLIKSTEISSNEISELKQLVNTAYIVNGKGIVLSTMERTSIQEITAMIQQESLFGLRIGHSLKGCIHVSESSYDNTKTSGLFSMLAVEDDPQYRGKGYGTLLVNSAEEWAKEKKYTHMMLELLTPLKWKHTHIERLENWYVKRGYEHVDTKPFPHPEILIPQEYIFKIFSKKLLTSVN